MGRSRLRRALLLGYARVCDATAAPRSCRTDAADVDRGLAAIHAMVTHRIGPALEELHAVTARRGMGGGGVASSDDTTLDPARSGEDATLVAARALAAVTAARALRPALERCAREAKSYFTFLHSSQMLADRDEVQYATAKALLSGAAVCRGMATQTPEGAGVGFCDWIALREALEAFDDAASAVAQDFARLARAPLASLSRCLRVGPACEIDRVACSASQQPPRIFLDYVRGASEDDEEATPMADAAPDSSDAWLAVVLPPGAADAHVARCTRVCVAAGGTGELASDAPPTRVRFRPGQRIAAFAFYKFPWLAWIVEEAGKDGDGEVGEGGGEAWRADVVLTSVEEWAQGCSGGVADISRAVGRSKTGVSTRPVAPSSFAVSKTRGTACLQCDTGTLVVLDFECEEEYA